MWIDGLGEPSKGPQVRYFITREDTQEPRWDPLDGLAPRIMLIPDCLGGPVTSYDLVEYDD